MDMNELVSTGIRHPIKAARALRKPWFRSKIGRKLNQTYYDLRNGEYNDAGIDIFAEDWDNLIILDTCRLDYFKQAKEKHNLPGTLESRISRGSQTPEWLWANFHDREHYDTVYISATGMPYHLGVADPDPSEQSTHQKKYSFDLDVHDLVNLWKDPPEGSYPVLDREGRNTNYLVPAPLVADEISQYATEYPNKRLIIHLLEPHAPYLGTKIGDELHKKSDHPWQDKLHKKVDIPKRTLRDAYQQKLDVGVRGVKKILNEVDGKTVVTADHGEMLWERAYPVPIIDILHPDQMYIDSLVRVPWLIIDGDRKDIVTEDPDEPRHQQSNEHINNQLQALGYQA